jgi:hypothetical protein
MLFAGVPIRVQAAPVESALHGFPVYIYGDGLLSSAGLVAGGLVDIHHTVEGKL